MPQAKFETIFMLFTQSVEHFHPMTGPLKRIHLKEAKFGFVMVNT